MNRMSHSHAVWLLSVLGCLGSLESSLLSAPLRAVVSIQPQATFVERIGGSRVSVRVLVPPGGSPATYSVTSRQMADLSHARVLFSIGVPFERVLLKKIKRLFPDLRIVDTRRGIPLRRMLGGGHHGDEHEHEGGDDPHVWLNPVHVITLSRNICTALCELDPAGALLFRANLRIFTRELEEADAFLRRTLSPLRGRTMMVFHPAFGYLAEAYGLRQLAIEAEGKSPGARQLARLVRRARTERVGIIFVQSQFSRKTAEAIAKSVGAVVVPMDPLARDYIPNLKRMAETIGQALAGDR